MRGGPWRPKSMSGSQARPAQKTDRSVMYSQPTEDPTLGRTGPVKSGIPQPGYKAPSFQHMGMRQPAALAPGGQR